MYFTKALLVLPLCAAIYRAAHLPRSTWLLAGALAEFSISSQRKHFWRRVLGSPAGTDGCPSPDQAPSPSFTATALYLVLATEGPQDRPLSKGGQALGVAGSWRPSKRPPQSRPSINTEKVNVSSDRDPKQEGEKTNPEIVIQH